MHPEEVEPPDAATPLRVGAYIDGFNLYYGGRRLCGRGTAGWRWLDLRALIERVLQHHRSLWPGARIERIVYCTARVTRTDSPTAQRDQRVYIQALLEHESVDWVEYGYYITRTKRAALAVADTKGRPLRVHLPHTAEDPLLSTALPVEVADDGHLAATFEHTEEKGTDVNLAAHLLRDVFTGMVDAVVVVSNDSDLALPLAMAREQVPGGLVGPTAGKIATALRLRPGAARQHWELRLTPQYFTQHQLPPQIGDLPRPPGW